MRRFFRDFHAFYTDDTSPIPERWITILCRAFWFALLEDAHRTQCKWFGHGKHLSAELRFADSGGELIYCDRCGWSHQVWH